MSQYPETGLVEQLRFAAEWSETEIDIAGPDLLRIAADEIERLRAAVAQTQTISPQYAAEIGKQIDELETENAALRAQQQDRNAIIEECAKIAEKYWAREVASQIRILVRLRAMPTSLNDACRTMDEAAATIESLVTAEQTHFERVVEHVMSDDESELGKSRAELAYALHSLEREIAINNQSFKRIETLSKALANLRAILADQPFQNSGLSVYEINLILANEGGFMPDEAVVWFRASRGTFGLSTDVTPTAQT